MNPKEIKDFTSTWAKRLGLSHWYIKVRWMTKAEDKELDDCNGFTYWSAQHTHAIIALSKSPEDWKHTIVHELLHIRLTGHKDMKNWRTDVAEEIAINSLASALLRK